MKITVDTVVRWTIVAPLLAVVGGFWLVLQGVKWFLLLMLIGGPILYFIASTGDFWPVGIFGLLMVGVWLYAGTKVPPTPGGYQHNGISKSDFDAVCQQRDAARAQQGHWNY